MLDSVIRASKKYYPQTLLEECRYEIKKYRKPNLINDNLDSSSSDKSDSESDYGFDNGSDNDESNDKFDNEFDNDEGYDCNLLLLKTVLSFTELIEALTKNIFEIEILKCTFIII